MMNTKVDRTSSKSILCWDHCTTCGMDQNRFWIISDKQFEKQRAETLGNYCKFCKSPLISQREDQLEEDDIDEVDEV